MTDRIAEIAIEVADNLIRRHGDAGLQRFLRFIAHITGEEHPVPDDPRQMNGRPDRWWYPGLPSQPWRSVAQIPTAQALESFYQDILKEWTALRQSADTIAAAPDPRLSTVGWSEYTLYEHWFGAASVVHKTHLAACPATAALLARLQVAGIAAFTVLHPGGSIAPHCSPINAKLTCHLGLITPPECGIRVGGESRKWTAGKCLVFDGSFEHSVWNHSTSPRVVLLVDIWHPALTPLEVAALTQLRERLSDFAIANAL